MTRYLLIPRSWPDGGSSVIFTSQTNNKMLFVTCFNTIVVCHYGFETSTLLEKPHATTTFSLSSVIVKGKTRIYFKLFL